MPFDARSAWERSKQLAPFPTHLNPYYEVQDEMGERSRVNWRLDLAFGDA